MSIKTKLVYLKILLFGDKELLEKGKMLPCMKCDRLFKSHAHYGEWNYTCDNLCLECEDKWRGENLRLFSGEK